MVRVVLAVLRPHPLTKGVVPGRQTGVEEKPSPEKQDVFHRVRVAGVTVRDPLFHLPRLVVRRRRGLRQVVTRRVFAWQPRLARYDHLRGGTFPVGQHRVPCVVVCRLDVAVALVFLAA